jgi:hypothetical protein
MMAEMYYFVCTAQPPLAELSVGMANTPYTLRAWPIVRNAFERYLLKRYSRSVI